MSKILLPGDVWTSQPQYPVPPNSFLLGAPPIHLLNFGVGLVGLGERKTYTPTAITYAAGAAIFNGSTACITAETSALGIANGFALVCRFKVNTIGAIQCLLVKDYSGDGDRCLQFRIDAAGGVNFIRFNAAKSVVTNITGGTATAGRWHTAVAFFSGTGSGIYLDGRLVASDSVTTANNDISASTPLLIGCGYSATTHANTLFLGGSISVVAVLKKIPTELCRVISSNIWQIFAPQQRNIWVDVSGGTDVSVSVTGLTGTTALGDETVTAIQNASTSVTGLLGTSALGTVSVTAIQNASTSVTGLLGTSALGSVTVDVGGSTSVNVTGLTGTSALGTVSVTAVRNVSTSVTGLLGTSALGNITVTTGSGADVSVNVTGLSGTASLGTVLVWGLVDTAQTPNWLAISTTQTPNWTRIAT